MPRYRLVCLIAAASLATACGAAPEPSPGEAPATATASATPMVAVPTDSASPSPSTPAPDSPLTKPRSMSFDAMKRGMCVLLPDAVSADEGAEKATVTDCRASHHVEVIRRAELDGPDAWPGDKAVEVQAIPLCEEAFDAYVGLPYEESRLEFDYFAPAPAAWAEGSRRLLCVVLDPDAEMSTQSFLDIRE